jgi:uncharacterized protein YjbI with pentapeptide repeats
MRENGSISAIVALAFLAGPALAQGDAREEAGLFAPSAWDLELGAHAFELPVDEYIDYACGTNGGPPSLPVRSWVDFAKCTPESISGFHEIYFQYDDDNEYWAKAMDLGVQTRVFEHTSAYQIPVIASALFDTEGFLVGIRMITDPRVDVLLRENAVSLSNFLRARYGVGWVCEDLPRAEGEREYQGLHEKMRCNLIVADEGVSVMIETHNYRKAGQFAVHPQTRRATEGQFMSSTLYELVLLNAQDGQPRDPPTEIPGPSEQDLLVARALNCPGCDFQGANFKRADLRGANLAGANLAGANFHAAFLSGAILTNANLEGANLDGANIQNAMMYEARFDGASLVGADLTLTNAGKVQFIRADLTDARMVAMDLRHARMNDATIVHADISGSLLGDAVLTRSDLSRVIILQADMPRAKFINANLSNADLRASQMINVNLRGANLTNADFSAANLYLANFFEAILDGAVWVNTTLPGGFDPN